MHKLIWRRCWAPVLLGCAMWGPLGPVWADNAGVKAAPRATTGSDGGTRQLPGSVRFIDAPSSEKPAARERRLKRECKGRPNAGMCLGYTR